MSRIIFVPQYPTPMRYSEWWITTFNKQFREAGYDVITIGTDKNLRAGADPSMFSPIQQAIDFELEQIKEYCQLKKYKSDILFLSDISFPGLFCNILYHPEQNIPKKKFAFCHATSINLQDYFSDTKPSKYKTELGNSRLFNKIFVGSEYHKQKLNWNNLSVTSLPMYPPMDSIYWKAFQHRKKSYDIVSVSRQTKQKVDSYLESKVAEKFSQVVRKTFHEWYEYYGFLGRSKVLLITSKEETFGYQIIDAILSGCIPIAPNICSYPELLPKEYLYSTESELYDRLSLALNSQLKVPELLNKKQINDFYKTIIKEMEK